MKQQTFADRHIGITAQDAETMLQTIGLSCTDELMDLTIPADIRLKEPLKLKPALSEQEYAGHIASLAAKNKLYRTYIGMGWYGTHTPAVIIRNILENPVWYTSYTPYQAEISQGRLEALMNFQTVVCDLTGMPLSNCSLLDEATAAAEAASMMYGLRSREQQKRGANTLLVDENIFPQTLAVLTTRLIPLGITLQPVRMETVELTPDVFGVLVQYPDSNGAVYDYREITRRAHEAGCKVAVAADILSLALLTPPGEWGADMVVGSTQ